MVEKDLGSSNNHEEICLKSAPLDVAQLSSMAKLIPCRIPFMI